MNRINRKASWTIDTFIDAFSKMRVLVIGEAISDTYLDGNSSRLCAEAPIPVVVLDKRTSVPGGAANTAVNAKSLGAEVSFLSVIGDDLEGNILKNILLTRNIKCDHLIQSDKRETLVKHRLSAGGHFLARFDCGTTDYIDYEAEEKLIYFLTKLFPGHDAVIISDYNYGIFTPKVISAIANLQSRFPRILVGDAKNLSLYQTVGLTAVKPNYTEAARLLGIDSNNDDRISYIAQYREELLEITGAQIVAVTLDSDGALIFEVGNPSYRTYARSIAPVCVTGAGDTFVAAFTLSLVADARVRIAAELASVAAAIAVSKNGTSACSAQELKSFLVEEAKKLKEAMWI